MYVYVMHFMCMYACLYLVIYLSVCLSVCLSKLDYYEPLLLNLGSVDEFLWFLQLLVP